MLQSSMEVETFCTGAVFLLRVHDDFNEGPMDRAMYSKILNENLPPSARMQWIVDRMTMNQNILTTTK